MSQSILLYVFSFIAVALTLKIYPLQILAGLVIKRPFRNVRAEGLDSTIDKNISFCNFAFPRIWLMQMESLRISVGVIGAKRKDNFKV